MLAVAETFYRERPGVPISRRAAVQNAKALGRPLVQTDELAPDVAVHARVNHGRWVVDCPWCAGAQVASRTDRRFLCADCFNSTVQGRMVPVDWPAEHAEIEAELGRRPHAENQNWLPGETVGDLRAERTAAEKQGVPAAPPSVADLAARVARLEALLAKKGGA